MLHGTWGAWRLFCLGLPWFRAGTRASGLLQQRLGLGAGRLWVPDGGGTRVPGARPGPSFGGLSSRSTVSTAPLSSTAARLARRGRHGLGNSGLGCWGGGGEGHRWASWPRVLLGLWVPWEPGSVSTDSPRRGQHRLRWPVVSWGCAVSTAGPWARRSRSTPAPLRGVGRALWPGC